MEILDCRFGYLLRRALCGLFAVGVCLLSSGLTYAGGSGKDAAAGSGSHASTFSSERTENIRIAQAALRDLRSAYSTKSADAFFRLVDDGAYLSVSDLRARLAADFAGRTDADIYIFVDYSMVEGEKTVLKTHWQKRTINRTEAVVKTDGKANFVFRIQGDRAMLLDIQGSTPF